MKDQFIWAPEIIKESNGIACGDMLCIHAYRENGRLFFSYSGRGCSVAMKMAHYLEEELSGKLENTIFENVKRLHEAAYLESESWIGAVEYTRRNCIESPISLLYGILQDNGYNTTNELKEDGAILACDACVSNKPLNWEADFSDQAPVRSLHDIFKSIQKIDDSSEAELQELGLCVLSKQKQESFERRLREVSVSDLKKIKKLRLASLYFNNSMKYGLKLDRKIEEMAVKQVVSMKVASEEINIINNFISEKQLQIDAVKGGVIANYYPEEFVRTHMDFDYLAADFTNAFILISFLINKRNFKMVVGGSVPFSVKSVRNIDGEEMLTGHLHLEKVLQDRYQVVVDINMGGFPLGRTGIIQCNESGKLEFEDLICITVSHLFKHEHTFMKDLNDLYYMLKCHNLDVDQLICKLIKHDLVRLFSVAYDFLRKNTDLDTNLLIEAEYKISSKRKDQWPYSRKSHFILKAKDMFFFNCALFGEKLGKKETLNQICNNYGEIPAQKFFDICHKLNVRTYLYPLVIFSEYQEKIEAEEMKCVGKNIFMKDELLILPIGIFAIQNYDSSICNRNMLNTKIRDLISLIGIENCNDQFVMEARRDIWLY